MAKKLTRSPAVLLALAALAAIVSLVVWKWAPGDSQLTTSERGSGAGGSAAGGSAGPAELVATVRSEPRSFNRLVARDRTSNLVSLLVHGKLVRINLESQEVEPALAERWTASPDGRTFTFTLREGVAFSDGTPFTSADVTFSLEAIYDEKVESPLRESLTVAGRPLAFRAPDARTVEITFPQPFGPGVRLLDNLTIVPRHRLEAALRAGTFRDAWGLDAPLDQIAGLGPFVLNDYKPGERLVFERNPRYWARDPSGRQLPYLDRLRIDIVPDQNAEILRLESGATDLITAEVRPDDLAAVRKAADAGRLTLRELGVGLDPDYLFFNLTGAFARANPSRRWLQQKTLREAVSLAVDRQVFADTVYLGAGVPINGPVTPGNRLWHDATLPAAAYDQARARTLLAGLGLVDRTGDGLLDTSDGRTARFSILTQKGNTLRERGAVVLQDQLAAIGLEVDVVTLEQPALIDRWAKGDYEAIYFGTIASDTDPASNVDFWLSSGAFHPWNPGQEKPATDWERRIDELMLAQVAALDAAERRRLFGEVQRIFAAETPAIYFVAPRVFVATSPRVANARPALLQPQVLWSAETLGVRGR